jgi:uncharacterized protein (UPF0333 family)
MRTSIPFLQRSEKGQAGLEFVIVTPVLLLVIVLLGLLGNKVYQKLSAQTFAYSHCMWEVSDLELFPGESSAASQVINITKKTWSTEGVYESYPTNATSLEAFNTKTCVGSVTHDDWRSVGIDFFSNYSPDLLVESRLALSRSIYTNTNPRFNLPILSMWKEK